MMYCTRCGSDLKGNKTKCPVCGYPVEKMRRDLSTPREPRREKSSPRPWAPPIPDERKMSMEEIEAVVKGEPDEDEKTDNVIKFLSDEGQDESEEEEDPRIVSGCSVCGGRPDQRCFFCFAPICPRHTVSMRIYVRNAAFGNKVPACPSCANKRAGRNPTPSEAEEAGMYFTIKPYHEWRKV